MLKPLEGWREGEVGRVVCTAVAVHCNNDAMASEHMLGVVANIHETNQRCYAKHGQHLNINEAYT